MATNIPLNTPLQQQIDAFIAEGASWLPTDLLRDLLRPIGPLVTSGAARRTRQRGEPLAPAHAGAGRHELLSGPMVSVRHPALRAYQQAVPLLQAGRATLVAISRQTPDHSKALAEKLALTFALLSDRGNQVARAYGLAFTIDQAVRRAYPQVGADLPAFNGTDAWDLPMAGTFPVDRSGTAHLAFVDPDFTRRLDPSVIVARLNELKD